MIISGAQEAQHVEDPEAQHENQRIEEAKCQSVPPFIPVPIFQTLTQALRESPSEPFIVRNCPSFGALNVADAIEKLAKGDSTVFGWDKNY